MANYQQLFYQGQPRRILEDTIDRDGAIWGRREAPWIIASLALMSRIDESQWQLQQWQDVLSQEERIMCRFFQGVTQTRTGNLKIARSLFQLNTRERRRDPSLKSLFFIYQGLAFYRFQKSRFPLALKYSNKAFEFATLGNFIFGKVFAADLRGHALTFVGEVSQGLHYLKIASDLALKLGNQAISKSIESSIFFYQARYGIRRDLSVEIQNKIENPDNDGYSIVMLLMEHARQQTLKGKIDEALTSLEEASFKASERKLKKQSARIKLRIAHNYLIKGNLGQAVQQLELDSVFHEIEKDPIFEAEWIGLKIKSLQARQLPYQQELVRLDEIARHTGIETQARKLARLRKTVKSHHTDDPLGDVIDRVYQKGPDLGLAQELLEKNYPLFLYQLLGVQFGEQALYIDFIPGIHAFFFEGNVWIARETLTDKMKLFLTSCRFQIKTKEELIKDLWGYNYSPFRHDHLIYNLAAKVRRFLGPYSHWLESSEAGYGFTQNLRISENFFQEALTETEPDVSWSSSYARLNIRQINGLDLFKDQNYITVRSYMDATGATKVTATRDLSSLVEHKKIRRTGRGRATAYIKL